MVMSPGDKLWLANITLRAQTSSWHEIQFTKNVNLFEDHEVTNYGRDEVYGIKDQIYGQDSRSWARCLQWNHLPRDPAFVPDRTGVAKS